MILAGATLPFFVQRGYAATLTCVLLDDDGVTPIVPTAATLEVYLEGVLIESPTATAGATNSATLAATSTTDKALGRITARWVLTIAGVDTPVTVSGMLVLSVLYPVLTDDTLMDPDYADMYARTGLTSFEPWRTGAWEAIERWLIGQRRRPAMILNAWALVDLHRAWTLEKLCTYLYGTSNDPYWKEQAAKQAALRADQQTEVLGLIEYDTNADGTSNDSAAVPGVLWLNSLPEPF